MAAHSLFHNSLRSNTLSDPKFLSYKTLQTLISDNKVLLQEEKINQINTQEFELLEGITFVFHLFFFLLQETPKRFLTTTL